MPPTMPATISFRFSYSRKCNFIIVEDISVRHLPLSRDGNLFVRIQIAGKRCDTYEKAWKEELIYPNERLEFNDVKEKNLKRGEIKAKVMKKDTEDVVSRMTLPFSQVELVECLLISVPLEPVTYGELNRGQLFFSVKVIGENEGFKISDLKATNLYQTFNRLCFRCRLVPSIGDEKGRMTEEKAAPDWRDELALVGAKLMDRQLNIQVLGPSHHGVREVSGEISILSADIGNSVAAVYRPLVMRQIGELNFSSIFSAENGTLIFQNICCKGLINVHAKGMINPYLEVQQLKNSSIVKTCKTKPISSTQNPVFKLASPMSFYLGSDEHAETVFKFTVKSKRSRFSKKIRIIGALVIGPFSKAKWRDFIRTPGRELHHTYILNDVDEAVIVI